MFEETKLTLNQKDSGSDPPFPEKTHFLSSQTSSGQFSSSLLFVQEADSRRLSSKSPFETIETVSEISLINEKFRISSSLSSCASISDIPLKPPYCTEPVRTGPTNQRYRVPVKKLRAFLDKLADKAVSEFSFRSQETFSFRTGKNSFVLFKPKRRKIKKAKKVCRMTNPFGYT